MGTDILAFEPVGGGLTVKLTATAATSRMAITGAGNSRNIRIHNAGPNKTNVRFGDVTIEATEGAGLELPLGLVEILGCGPSITHMAAICASTETAAISITSGHGV